MRYAKEVFRLIGFVLLLTTFVRYASANETENPRVTERPNILFIFSDDHAIKSISAYGGPLAKIQEDHPETMIGSYPKYDEGNYTTQIVVRGRDESVVQKAMVSVEEMLANIRL